MKLIKSGKTKNVYALENGNYLLQFKDSVTGGPGGQIDPGGNEVVGQVSGMGLACLKMSANIFQQLEAERIIPTHMIRSDFEQGSMEVRSAKPFGHGLEFVVRFIATGSFVRRYSQYVRDGQVLNSPLIEITIKNDELGDPLINDEALVALDILKADELELLKDRAVKIAISLKNELASKSLTIYDMKVEFGRSVEGELILIDEISPGSMRVFKGNERVAGLSLAEYFL